MIRQQGSNRVYTRVTGADGRSLIRVDGTNADENKAFVYMARHFHAFGLPVPELYSVSEDGMSYTQEDLGDTLLFDAIRQGRETGVFPADERTLLKRTIRALAHLQVTGALDFDWSVCFPVPQMDERSVRWDLNYFKYCFLKGTGIEFSEPALEDDFDALAEFICRQAQGGNTFLHRDCQSRNVMIKDGQPYFIDFQGGRKGPTQYDVASFLWQAKAHFPPSLRNELIDAYLDELHKLQPDLAEQTWRKALPHFVLFRTLQVLGAYGFRGFFERKQHFLESVPAALCNLSGVLGTFEPGVYPELTRLALLLAADPKLNAAVATHRSAEKKGGLTVTVWSFSFKKGVPVDESGNGGGYVFDCRSTHNPGKYDEYKQLTGLDQPVIDFLEKDGEITVFLESVDKLVDHHVERYLERGFTHLQVAFGCTGGQHRSVYCAEHVARRLKEKYNVTVRLIHREQGIEK